MRRFIFTSLLLAGCAAAAPDPRPSFTERNVGQTLVTHVEGRGTQAVYMAPDGALWVWSSAGPEVQRGAWRYDLLATGAATTYQGAAGINYPIEELQTAWGICFQYLDARGRILRRPEGGDWNCALLDDYEALVGERAEGDVLGLSDGSSPGAMPDGRLMSLAELLAIAG